MKVFLDECVPKPAHDPLLRVLPGHQVDHLLDLGWDGRKDKVILQHAHASGYDVFITKDVNQLSDPDECALIRKAGFHHVSFSQREGIRGLALVVASLIAAMPRVVEDLDAAGGQRLVEVQSLSDSVRHRMTDPAVDPPAYW